jgi:nicotinamide mononucleotide transporter
MARLTDASYPYWDGSVAMISIVSQILMAQRKAENWIGWIIVNALSIPLYLVKGLYPTMLLYTILLGMAVIGWLQWKARLTP